MHGTIKPAEEARERAYSIPLEDFDVGNPELFRTDTFWPYFDRLRKEEPVHYCKDSMFGPYWSVTKYNDIMEIETNHAVFSSAAALGGITIRDVAPDLRRESFIAMDQPRHGPQRKTVAPMFTPTHLDELAINIRKRSASCLDNLPRNEIFDWVDKVSVELTTQMLAVLFDFPWEDRRKLTRWSDIATTLPGPEGLVATEEERQAELIECAQYFKTLWDERIKQPPKSDLLSMMAHSDATRSMDFANFLGNLVLLIVGGNDTTRNTLSGSIYALGQESRPVQEAAREPGAARQLRAGSDPLADAAGAHAPHRARGHRVQGQADQEGRQGRDVVRLGQPRRGGDRQRLRLHHRSQAAAHAPLVRLRHPPLRRPPARRTAAEDHLGGNPEALRHDRDDGRAEARLLQLREGLRTHAGAHRRIGQSQARFIVRPPRARGGSLPEVKVVRPGSIIMHGTVQGVDQAPLEAYSMQLDDIDVSMPELYRSNTMWPYFERLRKEDRSTSARRAASAPTGR